MRGKMANKKQDQEKKKKEPSQSEVIPKVQKLTESGESVTEMKPARAFVNRMEAGIEQILNGANRIQLDKPYTFIEMTAEQPEDMERVVVVKRDGKKVYVIVHPIVE